MCTYYMMMSKGHKVKIVPKNEIKANKNEDQTPK